MKSRWPSTPLGEMCSSVQYGYTASADEEPSGPKFLRIMDMMRSPIDWEAVPHCEISVQDEPRFLLRSGDIVVARTGQGSIGSARFVASPPRSVFASYLVRFSVAADHCARYVGYVVESPDYERHIRANAGGASRPSASAPVLGSYPVPTPPLRAQRKIAAVLAAYDELIENNLRRIEILEEMAEAVYREWFVNFRFPGYEDVALVDSPLGRIPEAFETGKYGDIASEVKDGVDPARLESDVCYVGLEHIPQESFTLTEHGRASDVKSRKWRFQRGDVLFGKLRPYFHKVAEAGFEGICSTDAIVIRPQQGLQDLALQVAFSKEFVAHAVSTSGGTDRPRAKWTDLADFDVVVPASRIREDFSRHVRPMVDLSATIARQNANLRATRDLLLPKVVSGDIDVSDLDIDTEWLAS